jgi:hypothetical protein
MKADRMNEIRRQALIEAIRDSGLSIVEFSHRFLARDHTTVYRWLSGYSPVPRVVGRWLNEHAEEIIGGYDERD